MRRSLGCPASVDVTRATATRSCSTVEGPVDAVVKEAARHTVVTVETHQPSLEEAFLALLSRRTGPTPGATLVSPLLTTTLRRTTAGVPGLGGRAGSAWRRCTRRSTRASTTAPPTLQGYMEKPARSPPDAGRQRLHHAGRLPAQRDVQHAGTDPVAGVRDRRGLPGDRRRGGRRTPSTSCSRRRCDARACAGRQVGDDGAHGAGTGRGAGTHGRAVGPPFELTRPAGDLASACLMLLLVAVAFGSISLAVGCATGHRGLASGVTGAVAVAAYVVNVARALGRCARLLRPLSPFRWYLEPDPLVTGLTRGERPRAGVGDRGRLVHRRAPSPSSVGTWQA